MDRAIARAALLNKIFTNPDVFSIIKANIGCETIVSFCLTNKNWCKQVFRENQLRTEVARCMMLRINDNLQIIRDMMNHEISLNHGNWNQPVGSPLFIELGDDFFAVAIQLDAIHELDAQDAQSTANFVAAHPTFHSTVQDTGKLFALLFNVNILGEHTLTDTVSWDPHYLIQFVDFDQTIPRNVREKLPFARVVEGHENQISLSPVPNLDVDAFPFHDLLDWPHSRRSLRQAQRRAFAR